jgi:F-type H+-transporting ATPase subunit gamma
VLDDVLTRYIESLVYQAVVENIACEQAARMVAMKIAHRQRRQADRRPCS